MRRRIWSALLALAMLLTLCPLPAFAAEEPWQIKAEPAPVEDLTLEGIGSIYDTIPLSQLPSFFNITNSGFQYSADTKQSYYNQLDDTSKAIYDAVRASDLNDGPVAPAADPSTYAVVVDFTSSPIDFENVKFTLTNDGTSTLKLSIDGSSIQAYISEARAAAWGALLYDHPELSWLVNTGVSYNYDGVYDKFTQEDYDVVPENGSKDFQKTYKLTKMYFEMSGAAYKQAAADPENVGTPDSGCDIYDYADTKDRAAIEAAIKNATDDIGPLDGKSTYEKVKVLYDWICSHMEYAHYREGTTGYDADEAAKFNNGWRGYQTAYSALVENITVCAGYAKSFKLLCDEYNIPCAIITGMAGGDGLPQSWGAHAWNYVQMDDGKWYGVDCTWGDQSTWIDYDYLLAGSTKFSKTRSEGTLYSTYAFAYPALSTGDYTDSSAPSAIEITLPAAEITSDKGNPGFKVPVITKLGETATKDIALSAAVTGGSGQQVEWVLSSSDKDITLVPGENNTATLKIPSYALADRFASSPTNYTGPVITVTARCSTAQAQKEIWIAIGGQTPKFVKILKGQAAVEADAITQGGSAAYSAEVYDQYGREMTSQAVTWSVKDAPADVTVDQNGKVAVAETAAAGDYTVSAASGSGSASVTVTVPQAGHIHTWSSEWSKDETSHWHACTDTGYTDLKADEADHTWNDGVQTTAPTYTAAGVKTFTCTVCSQTRTEPVAQLVHNYDAAWSKDNDYHWHACTDTGYTDLVKDKAGHTWDTGSVTKEPAAGEEGVRTCTCTVCGQTKTEPVEPTPSETTYTVTFNANGGSVTPESAATQADGTLASLPAPARSGYTFNGWYTAASGGTQVTASTVFSSSTTVYAQWTRTSSGGSTGGTSSGGTTPTLPVSTGTADENGTLTKETTVTPAASTSGSAASANVTSSVGAEIVKQAAENNSGNVVIAPEIKGGVTRTEVSIPAATVGEIGSKTNAGLTVSTPVADVTIPNSALSSLSGSGGTVKVTAEQTGNTVELSVTAGGRTVDAIPDGVTLTVPVEETTPGTVAVLVREDGTREVIRKSVADGESVTIPLDGSAKVEIVDNSRRFDDVSGTSWEAGAVAFASSHELFNGTSSTTFSPGLSMSRGMLAVVLYNLESNPNHVPMSAFNDVDSSKWYAGGVSWAAEQGIISGYGDGKFGPDDDITREQLAVMLWRYAGSPAAASSRLGFVDADRTSSWAMEAMLWATEKGIINGKGDGILDPTGTATRAQTAQMLKNFMEKQ